MQKQKINFLWYANKIKCFHLETCKRLATCKLKFQLKIDQKLKTEDMIQIAKSHNANLEHSHHLTKKAHPSFGCIKFSNAEITV